MRILGALVLLLSLQSLPASADGNLACVYNPSIRFDALLKKLGKSATRADREAASALAGIKNMCKSQQGAKMVGYFDKAEKDCRAACARGAKSSKEAPILSERNEMACKLRCDVAVQASLGEAQAYRAARAQALSECGSSTRAGATANSASSSQ